jgi:poly-gamma-glutamate synthesis protein (capsule biosynthesis protein)
MNLRRLALVLAPVLLGACAPPGSRTAARPGPLATPSTAAPAPQSTPAAGPTPERPQAISLGTELPREAIEIAAVGDVNLGGPVGETIATRGPAWPWTYVGDQLRRADIAVVNFEGTASDRGRPEVKAFTFRADPGSIPAMAAAGVDVASVANNHSRDFGETAFSDTLDHLRASGVMPVGGGRNAQEAWRPVILERKGLRIAFVAATQVGPAGWAATEATSGIAMAVPQDRLLQAVADAKQAADVVVVVLHWGIERTGAPTETQTRLATALVDAGAGAVLGHHPHVLQPVVGYRGSVIAYSLGNFVFTAPEATQDSMILRVGILPDRSIVAATVAVRIVGGQPRPAS